MAFPDLAEVKPSPADLQIIHQLEGQVEEIAYSLLKKIDELYNVAGISLQVATSESLTAGLIMSSLVNIPVGGWCKYGCFGVYDTDAKRVFNSVKVDDVYTHTCAKEMAVGLLKNSNATLAISVTGNAMPYFSDLEKLGEVFIGVASYGKNEHGKLVILYETTSINNCLYGDEQLGSIVKQKCIQWLNQKPDREHHAKRSDTAAISRMIRNYTAYHAIRFAIDFITKAPLAIPNFIAQRKAENAMITGSGCMHNKIPKPKYPLSIKEICVTSQSVCAAANMCKRSDVDVIPQNLLPYTPKRTEERSRRPRAVVGGGRNIMRKAPSEHAKEFDLYERKIGNDGEMWEIIETSKGVKRWKKVKSLPLDLRVRTFISKIIPKRTRKSKHKKHQRKTKKHQKKSPKTSLNKLKSLMKKYNVVNANTKHSIASALYRVGSNSMDIKDLQTILPFLEGKQYKGAKKLIQDQKYHPITNYKGMWKPQPKPLNKMSRKELIRHLRAFKKAWERTTTRNQDIDFEGSDKALRQQLKYYFSKGAKRQAADWLRANSKSWISWATGGR